MRSVACGNASFSPCFMMPFDDKGLNGSNQNIKSTTLECAVYGLGGQIVGKRAHELQPFGLNLIQPPQRCFLIHLEMRIVDGVIDNETFRRIGRVTLKGFS